MKWLHLSDIHYHEKDDSANTRFMRTKLLDYLNENNFEVNRILFTGDFRYAPAQESQSVEDAAKDAACFLHKVADAVKIENYSCIFTVPGNHDLIRAERDIQKKLIGDRVCRATLIQDIRNQYEAGDFNIEPNAIQGLLSAFTPYETFLHALYGDSGGSARWESLKQNPHCFHPEKDYDLIQLNTALTYNQDGDDGLSTRSNNRASLIVGSDLVLQQLSIRKNTQSKPLIVIAHHDIECLREDERNKLSAFMQNYGVDLYLCGHRHMIGDHTLDGIRYVTTGCIKQAKDVFAGFSVVSFCAETREFKVEAHTWRNEVWAQDFHVLKDGFRCFTGHNTIKASKDVVEESKSFLIFSSEKNAKRQIFEDARKSRIMYIFSLGGFIFTDILDPPFFRPLLDTKQGDIRFILQNPDSTKVDNRAVELDQDPDSLRRRIENSVSVIRSIQQINTNIKLALCDEYLRIKFHIFEEVMYLGYRIKGEVSSTQSPVHRIEKDSHLYKAFFEQFLDFWDKCFIH